MKAKCPFNPIIYLGSPMGQFHCPWCGEMVMGGMKHLDYGELDFDEEDYKELVGNMNDILTEYIEEHRVKMPNL
jgi:predicted secreted protein